MYSNQFCVECEISLVRKELEYSMRHYNAPLCIECQDWIEDMADYGSTNESIDLYLELRKRKVPAELEKFDGYKTIDIAVPAAKVNIEVDGGHHNYQARQALADLRRTYHSFRKGYLTLRIPNVLVHYHLEDTADMLAEMLELNYKAHRKVRRR